jgi:glycosyltransferase involved in cell wall biosynthesis
MSAPPSDDIARRLERRLEAAARELREIRAQRDRLAADNESLRASSVDFQDELQVTAARLKYHREQVEKARSAHRKALAEHQRLRAEIDRLNAHVQDRGFALKEVRELFSDQRALVDETAGEIRGAVAELRRAEATVSSRLGHAVGRVARHVDRSAPNAEPDPLYVGLAQLEALDNRLTRRVRPVLSSRTSRLGTARKRVTVICWEMGHNPLGRAHTLAEVLRDSHDVEIVGPLFPRFGARLWEPVRDSEITMKSFPGTDLPGFVADAERFVRGLQTDVVFASKPRFPSLLLAMLIKHLRGVPVVLDVDDRELAFFGATAGITLDELAQRHGQPDFTQPGGESWTLACDSLIADADAVTVSSEALRDVYGGTVIPHARDERVLNPRLFDRDAIRAELGFSPEDRVVLFFGTPRKHKGLLELAEALQQLGDPRYKLCIVGTIVDPDLRRSLSRFAGLVTLVPNRPFSEVARTTLMGDLICLLQQPDDEIARYQTPAKLTAALSMGVPVLARLTPPLAPFARAGAIALVGDVPLAQRIVELLSDPAAARRQAAAGHDYFRAHLSHAAVGAQLNELIENLGEGTSEPPVSWRRALELARGARTGGSLLPVPAPPRPFPARRRTWDVVFFWKQNDSWIYGRRSDMLMKYLARSDRTRRLIHFDAPATWETVEYYRRRGRGTRSDQAAEIYRRLRRRALFAERHGKVRSYTFLSQSAGDPAGWERALLPSDDEYLGFIDHVLRRSGIGKRPVLFWVWPVNFQFPEIHTAFSPALTVADVVDDQRSWLKPGAPYYQQLTDNYQAVLNVSDVVLANCEPVRSRMSWFGSDALVVPNAMEIVGGSRRRRPPELRRLEGPIIGYVGNLGARLDLPLLERLAAERRDCQIVVIGSTHLSDEILALDRHANVHFLGVRPYPDVLRYITAFDVAIIPHLDDELTRSMNPLKAFVYAGCGVPVVTTEIANLPDLETAIRVAPTHDAFLAAVGEILEQAGRGAAAPPPLEVLQRHTWVQRVSEIERILDSAGDSRAARSSGALFPA